MAKGNDQLFQKRKAKNKKDLARAKASLQERRRALIVCEGKKTEPLYLKGLVGHLELTTIDIEICCDSGSAPKSIVAYGKEKLKSDPDLDMIFFVFDRDTHDSYIEALSSIQDMKRQTKFQSKTIMPITSIPCFEIWFLLHFEAHRKPYCEGGGKSPCGNLISELKKKPGFENYEKSNSNYFELLLSRLTQAKKNSAQTLKQSEDSGDSEHQGNPTTLMHILVNELENLAEESKR